MRRGLPSLSCILQGKSSGIATGVLNRLRETQRADRVVLGVKEGLWPGRGTGLASHIGEILWDVMRDSVCVCVCAAPVDLCWVGA